jgi:hypothetical protein
MTYIEIFEIFACGRRLDPAIMRIETQLRTIYELIPFQQAIALEHCVSGSGLMREQKIDDIETINKKKKYLTNSTRIKGL